MGNIKYIEIDGESGLVEFSLVITEDAQYSIVFGDVSGGAITGLQLGETSTTAYRGDRGKIAYDHSQVPHAAIGEPLFVAWLNSNPLSGYLTQEVDPVFTAWLATNPLSAFLTEENDPVFAAWLSLTPPLYSFTEADPVFQAWLLTNPLAGFLTSELDPVFTQWLATNPLAGFLTDAPSNGSKFARKNGTWTVVNEGISNVYAEKDPLYPIDYLKFTLNGNNYYITEVPKANGILVGGIVSWDSGLTFDTGNAAYYIGGELYTIDPKSVTHDAADLINPRIDIIIINTDSEALIIKGIPDANPQKPTPDPLTQIELTQVLIPANATEPGVQIDRVVIYDENIEWTTSVVGTTADFNSTVLPFKGTKCANITTIGNNDTIVFTAGASINISDYSTFMMMLKLKVAATNQHNITLQFFENTIARSTEYIIPFNRTYADVWQSISIGLSNIQFTAGTVNKMVLKWTKQGSQSDFSGFYLDNIKLEAGIQQPPAGVEADPIFNQWKNTMFGFGAKQTGVDAGTLYQRSLTNDYEYICVQGGIAGVAIWKKTVLFQT